MEKIILIPMLGAIGNSMLLGALGGLFVFLGKTASNDFNLQENYVTRVSVRVGMGSLAAGGWVLYGLPDSTNAILVGMTAPYLFEDVWEAVKHRMKTKFDPKVDTGNTHAVRSNG